MKYLVSFNHFLRLCMGTIIFPTKISGIRSDSNKFIYYPYWLRWFYDKSFKNPDGNTPIICYYDLKNNFERIMQKWFELSFKTYDIMHDVFSMATSDVSLYTKFTEYSHILQRFYKSIESSDNTFKEKLNSYVNLCPDYVKTNIVKNNFLDKIVNMRNYHVHGVTKEKNMLLMIHMNYYI